MKKTLLLAGMALMAALGLALALGFMGGFMNTALAQGPNSGSAVAGGCHDNTAVLDLLRLSATDLQNQRKAGKSWLDIATAQGVTEQALADALLNPMLERHDWMEEQFPQMYQWMQQRFPQMSDERMEGFMKEQVAQDIRTTQFGTMTDLRLFGGPTWSGMMGNGSGFQGMMNGWNGMWGMMGGSNSNNGWGGMMRNGGMMNGWNGNGGMMGGSGMMGNTQ